MVPASTLMYGSIFCRVTRKPRASSSAPIEAAARPLPSDDTTPPVTRMYFGANSSSFHDPLSDVRLFQLTARERAVEPSVSELRQDARDRGTARDAERDDVVAAQGDHTRLEPDEPVERRAHLAVGRQPEPGELDRRRAAELARAGARGGRGGEPRRERGRRGVRALEHGQRPAREPEPACQRGGGGRMRFGEGERHEPDTLDVEPTAAG